MNPIIPGIGMSDPHVRVFDGTLHLFSGHDEHPEDRTWVMRDWRIHASADLVNWMEVGRISPADNFMGAESSDCWAGDAATRNARYYFYFSDRTRGIGVMVADHPQGPYRDALGGPLVAPMHDPTILIDDDPARTAHMLYGEKSAGYHLARLNHDMISVAEKPRPVRIEGSAWESAPRWMDKNFIFKHDGWYYLSWGRDYAVSRMIEGPYVCAGAVGHGHGLGPFAHGSFFWWKGQFYHVWCRYLRSGFKYRDSIMTYCHLIDGRIVTDTEFLDAHFAHGVGRYEATWPKIRAAWFYECSRRARKVAGGGGRALMELSDGEWLRFANMDFSGGVGSFTARCESAGAGGVMELRVDGVDGPCIGGLSLSGDAAGSDAPGSCPVSAVEGTRDLYMVVRGDSHACVSVDWFTFAAL